MYGNMQIRNRFASAPKLESMGSEHGEATDQLISHYRHLARGEVGLIFTGVMYVHPLGRAYTYQLGIDGDDKIQGLRNLTDAVHQEGSRILFQIIHAGCQTKRSLIGRKPLGPSRCKRSVVFGERSSPLDDVQIKQIVESFGDAARRAADSGADGVHIGGAGGYLINQFLSPFFNKRKDDWGGSPEKRFRLLAEIILEIRQRSPKGFPISVKINTSDGLGNKGITPDLADQYIDWLVKLGIEGLEIASGTVGYSYMNLVYGGVPAAEFLKLIPPWMRPFGRIKFKMMANQFPLQEGWNIENAKRIKPRLGNTKLFLVGGIRRFSQMKEIIEQGHADFISLCRPLIREPTLIRKFREGTSTRATCTNCNRCYASVAVGLPVQCYCQSSSAHSD
jgi:2,4-dienoyl-CoA reductase-like NADH-dependent reductase (Old Yellow Enzyme family)